MNMFTSILSFKTWVAYRSGKLPGLVLAGMLMVSGIAAQAQTTVTSLTDSNHGKAGYVDGSTFLVAQFHTPMGIAIDETYDCLYVADRDNNAIRMLDLGAGYTSTIFPNTYVPASLISKPVGVQVDSDGNIFVLNRGSTNSFSTNGTVLEFDYLFNLVATNATKLTNATSLALDPADNIYVTVRSNSVIQISPSGAITNIVTITNAGTSLQGIIVKHNGLLAVSDSGRNGVYLINPANGLVTTNAGFNGAGDYTGINNRGAIGTAVKFFQPSGVAEAGDGSLIVADTGNNRVKVVTPTGLVTNLYGVSSIYWSGTTPGWLDGTVKVPDALTPNVQARLPVGLAFANNGTLYTTEDYYHLIREVTGSGLPQPSVPPPPTQVPNPIIGWVAFSATADTSIFQPGLTNFSSFVFNNIVPIVIEGNGASQVFYNIGATSDNIPDPTSSSSSALLGYADGLYPAQVAPYSITNILPDMTIKAIGEKNDGSPNSGIVQARFQFITANPVINGLNAAQFTVSDITSGALMYYTTDGSTPTNDGSGTSIGPITNGATLSFNIITNTSFQIKAFNRPYFQDSSVVTNVFSPTNYVANTISFGFANGEASSQFFGSPGETFYAPVTLTTLPSTLVYSLQFNLTVTNASITTNAGPPITPGAYSFTSLLWKPVLNSPSGIALYKQIPPYMFIGDASSPPPTNSIISYNGGNFVSLLTTNLSLNLLGVGWLERIGETNLYDTASQTLISYSFAHDDLFPNSQEPNGVILGGYAFQIPSTASIGQQYKIQIGRPSATDDGQGHADGAVIIVAPTNGATAGGPPISAVKYVTVGQQKYLVGDVYPFQWFNAGDFGYGDLTTYGNADAEQVFQAAIYQLNGSFQAPGSDFFDAMDSCGNIGVLDTNPSDVNYGCYTNTFANLNPAQLNALFNGNDTTINQIAFGDGTIDVCDVYVTFRRSLDPSLTWFRRFWSNGQRVADTGIANHISSKIVTALTSSVQPRISSGGSTVSPQVNFTAGDITNCSAGQVVTIPINATVYGSYPLRVLMFNVTIEPLDGSPSLTTPVQFTQSASVLGTPFSTDSKGNNFAAVWLNSTNSGLTGTTTIGYLSVTIPPGVSSNSAYAVHFDHASASPNGIASFPKQTLTGLVLLSSRTNSSYGDGIPDSWRLRWFGTTNNLLSVSNACPSGDGIDNYEKYVAGVDPNTAGDFPSVNSQAPVPSGFTSSIHWQTQPGIQYVIERSSSLFSGTWTAIATNTGTGADMEFDDNYGGAVKFYRVRILP